MELTTTPVYQTKTKTDDPGPPLCLTLTLTAGGDGEAAALGRLAHALNRRFGQPGEPTAVIDQLWDQLATPAERKAYRGTADA